MTQLPRRDTEPGSAILGFKAGEFGELAFITGIFSARRVSKGSRKRGENWGKEGRRTGVSWPGIKGVNDRESQLKG